MVSLLKWIDDQIKSRLDDRTAAWIFTSEQQDAASSGMAVVTAIIETATERYVKVTFDDLTKSTAILGSPSVQVGDRGSVVSGRFFL